MQPTVAIHGSCVSRDLAEYHGYTVSHYQARSSLCSKTGQKAIYDPKSLENIESNFQRRMVEWDLTKKSFETREADYVLMDLIDERFDICSSGTSHFTRSQAFFKSGVRETLQGEFTRVKRGSESHLALFQKGAEHFARDIDRPIILHNACWASSYRDGGEIYDFENTEQIKNENNLLEVMTKILSEVINFDAVVESPQHCISDASHKWGLASFHYIPEYYIDIHHQLIQVKSLISG